MKKIKISFVVLVCLLLILPMKSYASDRNLEVQTNNSNIEQNSTENMSIISNERQFRKY